MKIAFCAALIAIIGLASCSESTSSLLNSERRGFIALDDFSGASQHEIDLVQFVSGRSDLLLFSSKNGDVCMIDLQTHRQVWDKCQPTLQAWGSPVMLGTDPSGRLTVVGGLGNDVTVLDTRTGRILQELLPPPALSGSGAMSTAFSKDLRYLASAQPYRINVYDLQTSKHKISLHSKLDSIHEVQFSDDMSRLFVAGQYGIEVWDLNSTSRLKYIELKELGIYHPDRIDVASRTNDWRYVAVSNWTVVKVISLESMKVVRTFPTTGGLRLDFRADDSELWILNNAGNVDAWNLASGDLLLRTTESAAYGDGSGTNRLSENNTAFSVEDGIVASPHFFEEQSNFGIKISALR